LWETISKGETWQGEWVNRKKSGETYWEDVNISPIRDKEGKIINYLAIKRDITEWKKAQTEISELTLSLEKKVKERTKELHEANIALTAEIKEREIAELELLKARNEAEKANHAKSEFLSRMSHELRTPMNSILGFAQLLEMGIKDEKQRKGIIHILNSGKHLLSLINEVLEISRIEAGKLSFSLEPVKIGNLLIQVAEVLQNYANEKNVKIEIPEISPDIYINADKQKLKQVLLNLVNNAIKYNRENGNVALKIEFGKRTNSKQREVKILVCDTGIGINKKNIKKLFNPFERIGAQETSIEGSGLGLAVSKKLTEAMGGKIGVESSEGNGSIFWIKIPETKFKEQAFDVATEIETGSVLQKKIKGSILYVEDNESNIELVQETINAHRQGIKLHIDRLGSNAISLAKQMNPKLILLDLNLPNMEGEEILNQIMRNKDLSKIPVVIVSADAMREQIDKLVKQGAKDYLTKPIDLNRLLDVVDKYFF
jgi:signal transduction histidine kinase